MKETPILMCGEMVRAVQEGRKTQTRRVLLKNPNINADYDFKYFRDTKRGRLRAIFFANRPPKRKELLMPSFGVDCPYGTVGDRLWVKENWRTDKEYDPCPPKAIDSGASLFFLADNTAHRINHRPECGPHVWGKTRPSMFMPRWEITDIKVERIQDITAKDILAEGAVLRAHHNEHLGKMPVSSFDGKAYVDLKSLWAAGWDGINKKRGYGFATNCWVWSIHFKRI